ncbi:OmpA family protein [candidate division WOR-3 bacterium]|nr:OmpA family protein [candidate division WOR-3 bacterium]
MRVRVFALALLAAAFPALVFAYTGLGGGKGLFRVQNAMVEEEAGLTVSLHGLARNAYFDTTASQGWIADLIAPELSYAPVVTKYVGLELFGSWGGQFQTPKAAPPDSGFVWGLHDLKAGGKLSTPVIPVLKVGAAVSYTFKWRDSQTEAGWTVLDPQALPYNTANGLAWSALATIQLQDVLPTAPNLIFNYGKVGDLTQYAAAVELQGKVFGVFVEGVSLQPAGAGVFNNTTPRGHLCVTPGVVLGDPTSGFLKLGYTISSGNDVNGTKYPDQINLGLAIATPFGAHKPAAYGTLVGTVANASTGTPVAGAAIAFPDNPRMAAMTTEADGIFKTDKAPAGAVTVEVSAEGYNRQVVPVAVEEDKIVNYEFKLRPLKTYGTIAGTVVDAVTSVPMAALIEFPGTSLDPVNADPTTGAFRVSNVETGIYTITAAADKYVPATLTLAVEDNKLTTATFKLSPAEVAVTATGRVFDKKTDASLSATVTFDNAVFNTDPATGVYKAQLMPGSYTVVVESKDYVKQTTALIVEKGKPFVRDFAMLKVGMSITLQGIYFDFDQATIKPESKPALDAAARMLNENPTINVEIQGHTDSKGSDSYNLSLSDRRAAAVVTYLVQILGIDMSRLTSRGYGEGMPIATNDTDAGRALNRRVEFVITGQN